jgi:hypothetical protein
MGQCRLASAIEISERLKRRLVLRIVASFEREADSDRDAETDELSSASSKAKTFEVFKTSKV